MKQVSEEMRGRLRKLAQKIYDKIRRCRDREKSTWKRLADLEEHVETIYHRIDGIANDLVGIAYIDNNLF